MELMYMMRLSIEHRYPSKLSAGQQQGALARSGFRTGSAVVGRTIFSPDTVGRRKLEEEPQDIRQFYDGYVLCNS